MRVIPETRGVEIIGYIHLYMLLHEFIFYQKIKKPNNLNGLWLMVFNATINNISGVLVEETGVPGKSNRSVASHF
jgi:hypothetical protein